MQSDLLESYSKVIFTRWQALSPHLRWNLSTFSQYSGDL